MKQIFLIPDAAWASGTAYIIGQQITYGAHIQQVTTAGTSGGSLPHI